jgi:hypothetical protein
MLASDGKIAGSGVPEMILLVKVADEVAPVARGLRIQRARSDWMDVDLPRDLVCLRE